MEFTRDDFLITPDMITSVGHDMCSYEVEYLQETSLDAGTAMFIDRFTSIERQGQLYENQMRGVGYQTMCIEATNRYLGELNRIHDQVMDAARQGVKHPKLAAYSMSLQSALVWALSIPKRLANETYTEMIRMRAICTDQMTYVLKGPTPKQIRKAVSPSRIKRVLKKKYWYWQYLETVWDILRRYTEWHRVVGDGGRLSIDAYNDNIETLNRNRTQYRNTVQFMQDHVNAVMPNVQRVRAKIDKAKRKPVLKAMKMLEMIVGPQVVKDFVKGTPIRVPINNDFYMTQSCRRLFSFNWSGIKTDLYQADGKHVTSLCVYLEDTPAPEQLMGTLLHAHSGIIGKYIEAANLQMMSDEAAYQRLCDQLGIINKWSSTTSRFFISQRSFQHTLVGTPDMNPSPDVVRRTNAAQIEWDRAHDMVCRAIEATIRELIPKPARLVELPTQNRGIVPSWDQSGVSQGVTVNEILEEMQAA